ncbi:MAG: hypothetical protein BAJALOKI2v1_950010 [Promethearchaeota archaeon]|nr:MAG: hypothetical protein BAJALOKI2v1_950010 [Candidatus Lokiarchaeota archaeon]
MNEPITPELIRKFFYQLYFIVKNSRSEVLDLWLEFSEIFSKMEFSRHALDKLVSLCDFVKFERTNYTKYFTIDKISFIIESMKFLDYDIKNLSEILDYSGFEALIEEILRRNNMKTIKNFRFTDKSDLKYKTKQKRYEIDVIAIRQKVMLVIDAKQWKKRDSYSAINKAANLQLQRVIALRSNPDIFGDLITNVLKTKLSKNRYLPLTILPMMVTFEESGYKLNNKQIPLVSIAQLNSFVQELSRTMECFKTIQVDKVSIQKKIC